MTLSTKGLVLANPKKSTKLYVQERRNVWGSWGYILAEFPAFPFNTYFHLTLKNSYNLINLWPYPHQILRPSGATEKIERKGLTVVSVAIQSKGLLILSELVKKSELTLHKQLESQTVCNSRLLPRIKISIV